MQMIPLFGGPALGIPIGAIWPYAGAAAPSGFLLCDGSAVSRNRYAALFAVIGTLYGAGDGETTFNVPDLRGRTLIGAGQGSGLTNRELGTQNIGEENHTLNIEQLPAHRHQLHRQQWWSADVVQNSGTGSIYSWKSGAGTGGSTSQSFRNSNTDMSVGSNDIQLTGGGQPHNNMQPSAVVNYIICAEPIPVIKGEKGDPGPQYVFGAYPISGNPELGATWLSENGDSVPLTPEVGRIYLLLDPSTTYPANTMFRWDGSSYVNINVSIWG